VRYLLDAGAGIEAIGITGITPLSLSCQQGKLEVVRELLARGAVVDACASDGATPLMMASEKGRAAVVRELLTNSADANARDNIGWTSLHVASACGRAEALRELLKRDGIDVNAQSNNGDTPLMMACEEGSLSAAMELIGHGVNLALLSNAGESALRLAQDCVARDNLPPAAGAAPLTTRGSQDDCCAARAPPRARDLSGRAAPAPYLPASFFVICFLVPKTVARSPPARRPPLSLSTPCLDPLTRAP